MQTFSIFAALHLFVFIKFWKMKKITSLLLLVAMVALFSCDSPNYKESSNERPKSSNPALREAIVKEILQTTSYTYLMFEEDGEEYWGAIPRRDDIVKGNTYYFDSSMEMENFPSKELSRTFDRIFFIESISDTPFPEAGMVMGDKKGSARVGNMEVQVIEQIEDGVTIAELYENSSVYAGKRVKIHGKVVKFTPQVMGKNWVHIQDGTKSGNNFDITITTSDIVKNDDVATFVGLVVLDKDFGYGYAYELIIEEAVLVDVE